MQRRSAIVLCAVLAGCTNAVKPLADVLPAELAGGWKRGAVTIPSNVPALVSQHGPDETAETTYTGPGMVKLRAFRMRSETSAFELIQKWRQSEGIAAYKGPLFLIANGEGAADLLRELPKALSQ